MVSDQYLIERILDGDQTAAGELAARYRPRLESFAQHGYCPRLEDAQDVVQVALIRAFRSLKSFRLNSSFSTWLYRILINELRSRHRLRHCDMLRLAASENDDLDYYEAPDSRYDPAVRMDRQALAEMVREQVAHLSERDQTFLVLRDFQDLPYDEVAARVGMTRVATKSAIFRARLRLGERLEPRLEYGPVLRKTR